MFSWKLRKGILSNSRVLLSVAALLLAPAAMHATPITYNLTLTETNPTNTTTYSGTGTVTLNITGTPKDFFQYTTANGLTGLQFNIDGESFDLAHAQGGAGSVVFEFGTVAAGQVWGIQFAETNSDNDRLASSSGYIYYINNVSVSGVNFTGTFSATAAPAVPEPSSLALLGTGLFAGAGGLYRRLKFQRS